MAEARLLEGEPFERGFLGSCVADADGTNHEPCDDYPHCDCICHQGDQPA